MATTKVVTVLDNDVTLGASGADHTSTVIDLQDGYGGVLNIKHTNGATGPTIASQSQIQTSPDNSHWYNFSGALQATLGANIVTSWGDISIPIGTKYLKVISGSNTGQPVTLRVECTEVASII